MIKFSGKTKRFFASANNDCSRLNLRQAASIEWFDRWLRTGEPAVKQRILDYNEDDCVATRVVLDGIRTL